MFRLVMILGYLLLILGDFSLNVIFNKILPLGFSETVPIRTAFRRDQKSELLRKRMHTLETIK